MAGKTMAEHAREYRTRKAERIARMEAALREIAESSSPQPTDNSKPDFQFSCGWNGGLQYAANIARKSLDLPLLD